MCQQQQQKKKEAQTNEQTNKKQNPKQSMLSRKAFGPCHYQQIELCQNYHIVEPWQRGLQTVVPMILQTWGPSR